MSPMWNSNTHGYKGIMYTRVVNSCYKYTILICCTSTAVTGRALLNVLYSACIHLVCNQIRSSCTLHSLPLMCCIDLHYILTTCAYIHYASTSTYPWVFEFHMQGARDNCSFFLSYCRRILFILK